MRSGPSGLNQKLVINQRDDGTADNAIEELDDCWFHQFTRLDDFNATRTIGLIPPDKDF
jgi:hypothetical protein